MVYSDYIIIITNFLVTQAGPNIRYYSTCSFKVNFMFNSIIVLSYKTPLGIP